MTSPQFFTPGFQELSATRLCLKRVSAVAFLIMAFAAASVRAYVDEGASWANGTTVTFQFALGSAGRTLLDGNTSWDAAAMPAPSAWNSLLGGLKFAGVINPSAPVSSGDGVNTIAFSSTVFGQSFGSGTLAVTYYRYSGGRMSEADILVNNHQTWDSYRGALRFSSNGYAIGDIRRVLVHEMGHALGLAHPDQNGQQVDAIMNSMMGDRETPSQDDINGAQALYGAPAASSPLQHTEIRLPTTPLQWRIVGTGNFSKNGSPNIVWQNTATGERAIWFMNGTSYAGQTSLGTVLTQWQIVGAGDFNVDGNPDILWQKPATGECGIWLMNGASYAGWAGLPTVPTQWRMAAVGDLTGDGNPDILWQNTATGERAVWLMNRSSYGGQVSWGNVALEWRIAGTGDFNWDGQTDIIWQNSSSGEVGIWLMNGTTYSSYLSLGVWPTQWQIVGVADFNGDGIVDILWQNTSTGENAIWLMHR